MKLPHLTVGVIASVVLLAAANFYSYVRMPASSTIDDGFVYFGWPFNIYAYGGYYDHPVYLWTGALANLLLAGIVGVIIGLVFPKLAFR